MGSSLNTIQIDWLSLIIEKREESEFDEHGLYNVNPLLRKIFLALGAYLNRNSYNPKVLTLKNSGIYIEDHSEKIKLDFHGEYFLQKDACEKLEKLILVLKGYSVRITRIDYQITSNKKDEIFGFTRCKFSPDLESYVRLGKGQKFESFATFNTRFKVLIYNKSAQIKKALKRRSNYLSLFKEKYGNHNSEELWRIEISLKYADQLSSLKLENITTDKEFLITYIQNKKFPKKLIKFFKNALFIQ